jgi:hypothetical protein
LGPPGFRAGKSPAWLFHPAATGWYSKRGHEDGSVHSRYDHITLGMRQALMATLTEMWEETLDLRRAMSPGATLSWRSLVGVAGFEPAASSSEPRTHSNKKPD